MSTAAGAGISQGFSKPGVHSLTFKDDFCTFALELRNELLHHPNWKEMTQEGLGSNGTLVPHRQNGITTGHLGAHSRERLPYCAKFEAFLMQNIVTLCTLIGVNSEDAIGIEINAMAYGSGAWLSPHTDFLEYGHAENRLAAWMLYLTAPEDGEWSPEKGGAVRVWTAGGGEERIRPRFNRFAIFKVHNNSFHEIEKIMWQPEWPNCRLALSGWIQGRPVQQAENKARLYLMSSSAKERWDEIEARLQGSLALHRLLAKQRAYCGVEIGMAAGRVYELEQDYQAHSDSPPGTSFLRRAPGPAGCIIVVDEGGDTQYFGTLEGYCKKINIQEE